MIYPLAAVTTQELEDCLTRLQTVQPYDYDDARGICYGGYTNLILGGTPTGMAMLRGAALAFDLWHRRMIATSDLRRERAVI